MPMSFPPIKHVIFDVGNVIFDWDPKAVAKAVGHPEMWTVANTPHWQNFDRGSVNFEGMISTFLPTYPRIERFLEVGKEHLILKKETLDIFYKCQKKGLSIYILSNMPDYYRNYLLSSYPFFSETQGSIFSCDVGFIKPEKQIYECLFNHFSLAPQDCLFIDDRDENIEAGCEIGMRGIIFDNPQNCLQSLFSMKVL
jgi:putative hydrolase of the HAD superfamily